MHERVLFLECPTGSCGYGVLSKNGDCNGGDSSCANAFLAEIQTPSGHHTQRLREATLNFNKRVAGLGEDPTGQERKLSLLRTPLGVTLGWIRHGPNAEQNPPDPNQVRADDPRVIGELGIDQRSSPGDPAAAGRWEYEVSGDQVICRPGAVADCWLAPFLVAIPEADSYHPQAVRDAVAETIRELEEIEMDEAHGRKLALLRTADGMMLAWVIPQGPQGQQYQTDQPELTAA